MNRFLAAPALFAALLATTTGVADATVPVIDVAAITQLLQQIMAWDEQLQGMRAQLGQLRETTSALTGSRGMDQLMPIAPAVRNYLPTYWSGLANLVGGGGADPALVRSARAQRDANAVLPAEDIARFSPPLQALLRTERDEVAASQTVSRAAYGRSSDRFASLTTLIEHIRAAPDAKAIAELQGRIAAEQAMLANESIKLNALSQAMAAERAARDLARRETVLQSHGAFNTRFQPVPPVP
jgi:P-type DNA transfer protein VirB5